jgi:hydroxyacyl-ACP dehydratase HTD2-like protein with hotdog domain
MIGVERLRRYEVTDRDIRHFAQAIGMGELVAQVEGPALDGQPSALVAPPLFCQVFTFDDVTPERLPPDGSPAEMDVPIPARRAVGGGSCFEVFQRVQAGDSITVKSTLQDVFTKQGKSGVLYFIVVVTEFSNQKGQLIARETATYIKRP